MKAYTAAPPDVLRVDEKNLREHYVLNCCGVIITTNHKTDGIYLPADDRRHFVAWSNLTKEDFDEGYWNGLWGWYRDDGIYHVAAYLAQLDISTFDPKAPPPKTPAFWDIVAANRRPKTPNSPTSSTRWTTRMPSPSTRSPATQLAVSRSGSMTAGIAGLFHTAWRNAATSRCATTTPKTDCGSSMAVATWFTPAVTCAPQIASRRPVSWHGEKAGR